MTVTVTGPLGTPVIASISLADGGSLLASTTYYFRVVATPQASYAEIADNHSAASVEGTFTTDTIQKQVAITWGAITGANGYWVYLTTTPGVYSLLRKVGTLGGYSTATNSITLDGSQSMTSPEQLFASSQTMPGTLDKEAGKILISFTGATTLLDIYNAIIAAGYTGNCSYDGGTFILIGSIYITGTTAGALTEKNKVLVFLDGGLKNTNSNCTLTFGSYISATLYGYDGCTFYVMRRGIRFAGGSLNTYLYGCMFKNLGFGLASEANVLCGDTYVLRDQLTLNFSGAFIYPAYDDFYGSSDIVALQTAYMTTGGACTSIIRPILKNAYLFDYVSTNTQTLTVSDGVMYGEGYDIRSGRSLDDKTIFLNCTFPERSDLIPIISWDLAGYRGAKQFWFTLALKVVDVNGVGLSGASIVIKDVLGSPVAGSPFTTNATGDISTNLYGYRMTWSGGGTTSSTKTDQTPHTVTISKSGYITKKIKYTMDRKRDEIETLEHRREV